MLICFEYNCPNLVLDANQNGCNLWMTPLILCSFLTWSMWKFFGQNLHLCHVEREIDGFPRVGIQELLGLKCVTNPPLCWRFLWTLCHNGVKLFLKEHYISYHLFHDIDFPIFYSRIKTRYPSSFWSKDIDQLFFHLLKYRWNRKQIGAR